MKYALLAAVFLIAPAYAEEPAPTPSPPVSQVAPQLFYFEVDQNDINAISSALNELQARGRPFDSKIEWSVKSPSPGYGQPGQGYDTRAGSIVHPERS